MKPSSIRKVFGIISYFPDNDSDYHIETRRERTRRFRELLYKLEELWSDVDIMVIAQNWQDFELPSIKNKITVYHYGKLGILGARRELRKRFLNSDYDYLIMLDDDGMIETEDPSVYMDTIDAHPGGIGVIRHVNCPLMLLAISKQIYFQIDMPDIDAEKGEGFEDDVFVASCFAKFPDKAFDFPNGCIKETSFKYSGEGKCPSTWAGERKYDWKHMVANTKSKIFALEHPVKCCTLGISVENPTIDLIITYVNSSDNNWIRDYVRTTKTHNPTATRFRSWGTLRYLFRGIAVYMPFIRNVVLIVSGPTQVPAWLDTKKVRVVYHDEFIPKEYLPTFNSCTIESFFWNIKDLADKVIYLNDDLFPVGPMAETDFFTDNTPHVKFKEPENYNARNMFQNQSRNGLDTVLRALNLPEYPNGKILLPYHASFAIYKDSFLKIKELCENNIRQSISTIRQNNNINQYIYAYYAYCTNAFINETVNYRYFNITDAEVSDIFTAITSETYQMLCLNDSDKLKDYARTRYLLQQCFERKFPDKCKYEL